MSPVRRVLIPREMTVSCSNCGQEWERDPALEVACPQCRTDVGEKCKRPSGHPAGLHAGRDKKALREVDGYQKCPQTSDPPEPSVESAETDESEQSTFSEIL